MDDRHPKGVSMATETNALPLRLYSGTYFQPSNPCPEDMHIEDIARALSQLCRFGGHTNRFYSVAEHSVLVYEVLGPEHEAWGLLHDACEAYLVDIPYPLKMLPEFEGYRLMEEKIQRAVAERFGLPWPMPEAVEHVDKRLAVLEMECLFDPPFRTDVEEFQVTPLKPMALPGFSPTQAEWEFLAAFQDLVDRGAVLP